MTTRRDLLQKTAGALAGLVFVGCGLTAGSGARGQTRRREAVVNGKRAKTVDIHAPCAMPEALALINLKLGGPALRTDLDMATAVSKRLEAMDEQGVDVEALSINQSQLIQGGSRSREADHRHPKREARRSVRQEPRPGFYWVIDRTVLT
jgi:hypothetical protein